MIGWRSVTKVVTILGLVGMFWGSEARAGERFYTLIFGSQPSPKRVKDSHTWATFVRVVEGGDGSALEVYVHTISWWPATLRVRVLAASAEPGVNLDLDQTLRVVTGRGERVTLWGPFEISPKVYEKSLHVWGVVQAGGARYRAIDSSFDLLVADCIHAVAAVDPDFGRRHYPLIRVGDSASRYIARQVLDRAPFDQDRTRAGWLIPRLGLDRYPITVVPPEQAAARPCPLCHGPE